MLCKSVANDRPIQRQKFDIASIQVTAIAHYVYLPVILFIMLCKMVSLSFESMDAIQKFSHTNANC